VGNAKRRDGVSQATDELSAALLGDALDILAAGKDMGVLVVVEDNAGEVASFELTDDGPEELVAGAYERVRSLARGKDVPAGFAHPVRYALVYEGAVADEEGAYHDALLLEFGEKGYRSYSAYSYVKGRGQGDAFAWSEPAPAGEVEPLL
jgi:hypothetical protein